MEARELRYKFMKLSEEYGQRYVFQELLLYLNGSELTECYEEFRKNHPSSFYDEEGNLIDDGL